ncbi:hypothetical protein KY318_02820 [Candidatus Woesearchaeota archaeon]|nr:hypothetical protein [Candidatus Woesearchaeota archaeon]
MWEASEEVLEDIYTNFEEELEEDLVTPEEAAFMRGYMEFPEEVEE